MSRLTKWFTKDDDYGHNSCYGGCESCNGVLCHLAMDMIKKLAHYEDLEEQGELVVQKHGHWEILTDEYDCEYMLCTACGGEFYPVDDDTVDSTYNYCPNCGAKMLKGTEE